LCGCAAILLEGEGHLALNTQKRIWRMHEEMLGHDGVVDAQVGMNNLLVVFDPYRFDVEEMRGRILDRWQHIVPAERAGRRIDVGVRYGGEGSPDLADLAAHHGLTPAEVAHLHAEPEYIVFAPGTGPSFGYLFGLNARLFTPRRKVPVRRPIGGAVQIGGVQTNLGPPRRPDGPQEFTTGWHLIGRAPDVPPPFDLERDPPNLLSLGDRIRFRIESVES
jgi:KipI family sensor histidine kinase inhibitor